MQFKEPSIEDLVEETDTKMSSVMSNSEIDDETKNVALRMIMTVLDNIDKLTVSPDRP